MRLYVEVGKKGLPGYEQFQVDSTESVGNVFGRVDAAVMRVKGVNKQISLCDDLLTGRTVIFIDVTGSDDDHYKISDVARSAAFNHKLVTDS